MSTGTAGDRLKEFGTRVGTSNIVNTIKDKTSRFSLRTDGSRKSSQLEGYATLDSNGEPTIGETMACDMKITCPNGKALHTAIVKSIKEAATEFNNAIKLDDTDLTANDHTGVTKMIQAIEAKSKNFTKSHNDYLKKIGDKMLFDPSTPIKGQISLSKGFFSSGKKFVVCTIVGVRPKDKTVFVKWNDGKDHEIPVPISKVCIGGGSDSATIQPGSKCDFVESGNVVPQTAGAKKKGKKWGKANGSDSMSDGGICE